MNRRMSIVLDEELVQEGLKATGLKTKRALIDFALRDLLRRQSSKRILELKGTIAWKGDLSKWRRGRTSRDSR